MDFETHVGGIEDAILATLEPVMRPMGVKDFATYSGELDSERLKEALGALSLRFPLVMVGYSEGVDTPDPATSAVLARSLHFRHECSFTVICVTNDARGETARRRGKLVGGTKTGAYAMVSKVRELLTGLRFTVVIETVTHLLNTQPFIPDGVENIARLPNITAFAAIFKTAFKWSSPDRSPEPVDVTELIVGIEEMGIASNAVVDGPPGVSARVSS